MMKVGQLVRFREQYRDQLVRIYRSNITPDDVGVIVKNRVGYDYYYCVVFFAHPNDTFFHRTRLIHFTMLRKLKP